MKKILSAFLFFVLCTVLCLNAFAVGGELTLSAVQEKNEVVLTLNISENSQLCTTEIYIDFDAAVLEFKKGSETVGDSAVQLSPYITATEISEGRLKISYTCTEALENGGALCTVVFRPEADSMAVFTPEVEHAETFDGEHIRTISLDSKGCTIQVEKQFSVQVIIAVCAVCIFAAAATLIAISRKRKV